MRNLVKRLNDYFFDEKYAALDLPYFEFYADDEVEQISFGGMVFYSGDYEFSAETEAVDEIFEHIKHAFNDCISQIFQASADAQCRELDK